MLLIYNLDQELHLSWSGKSIISFVIVSYLIIINKRVPPDFSTFVLVDDNGDLLATVRCNLIAHYTIYLICN